MQMGLRPGSNKTNNAEDDTLMADIAEVMDDDGDRLIDKEELIQNYYIIIREISQNDPLQQQKKKKLDFFTGEVMSNKKKKPDEDSEDGDFLNLFVQICKAFHRKKRRLLQCHFCHAS